MKTDWIDTALQTVVSKLRGMTTIKLVLYQHESHLVKRPWPRTTAAASTLGEYDVNGPDMSLTTGWRGHGKDNPPPLKQKPGRTPTQRQTKNDGDGNEMAAQSDSQAPREPERERCSAGVSGGGFHSYSLPQVNAAMWWS